MTFLHILHGNLNKGSMSSQKEDFKCIAVDMGAGSIRVMLGVIDKEGIILRRDSPDYQ